MKMTNVAQTMIDEFETRRATLVTLATSATGAAGFAIKCGPLCIQIVGEKSSACGVEWATRFDDRAKAAQLAKRITNGNGERARVVTFGEALTEEINSLHMALTALREAVAKQA
jgi:hypothetical protein